MENNKTPSIRFKGFTDPWEQRKVSEVSEIVAGGTPSTSVSEYWEPKEVPWLSSGEVHKKYITYTDDMISKNGLANSSAKIIKKNSVLIALAGQGKTRGTVAINRISLSTNQSIAAMSFNDDIVPEFVFSNLENRYDEIRAMSSGDGSRGGLNKQLVGDITIPYTIKEEQQKIGQYFSNLDHLITLHQRKYNKLLNVKKSMLEKMFPKNGSNIPEIRFKGFTDPWEQRKLGDIGKARSGIGFPDNEQGGTDGIPFFKVSDMNLAGNETEMTVANNYVSTEQIVKKKWSPMEEVPAIYFAKVGAAVMLNRKRLCRFPFLFDNNTMAYSLDKKYWNIEFSKAAFSKIDLTKLIQVGALPSYNASDVENIDIMLPSIDEQEKIGDYFTNLDHLITLHQRELEKLQNIKKSMLEKMFV